MGCFKLGLTGGVASGKSTISAAFRALGVPVLDADQVSRDVVARGEPALAEIAEEFGKESLLEDGQLNRMHLRKVVFSDANARRKLEKITHPRIRQRILDWMEAQAGPYCVLENAILFESGMDKLVDRVLLVDVPEDVQRARLMQRDNIDADLVEKMLGAQSARSDRLERADDVLLNTSSRDEAAQEVARLHQEYLMRASRVSQAQSRPE